MALQMTWQPSLLSQKRKSGPPLGLKNLGNTCYLNSVLQCLTYTPPLANLCLKFHHSSSCDLAKEREKKSDCPFCILEKRIARSLSIDQALDAPAKINNCLKIFAEHFRFGRQEDAHEFLRYVIDACHNTCLRLNKLQQQRGKGIGISNGGYDNTVVKEIFGGALQSQVKCLSCGTESNKVDEIMDISLDVLHSGSLKESLYKFFQPEVLDGSNKYKCDNCKKLVVAKKQMFVLQAPNVLVIQLKRFEGSFGGKIDKTIAFQEALILSSYMCKASQDPNPEYNLFGTIVHSGFSPDSGHYYAYIKDAVGRWYCCNDSYVTLSNLQEVLSEKVYILFFTRTNQRPECTNLGLATNGFKQQDYNYEAKSKNMSKSVIAKQLINQQTKKDSSVTSTANKVPSTTQWKFGTTTGSSDMKRILTNGTSKKVVDKRESNGKNTCMRASMRVKKTDLDMPSIVDQGSVREIEPVSASGGKEGRGVLISNADDKFLAKNSNSVEGNGCVNGTKDQAEDENGLDRHLQNGSVNGISCCSGSKRKSQAGDSCVLFGKDAQSSAELAKFKQDLQREASLFLQSCGWTDKVYSFMRSRKKLCAREPGNDASNMKQLLIAEAKPIFIQQIPHSLKGSLIERLKSFSQGKKCLGSSEQL